MNFTIKNITNKNLMDIAYGNGIYVLVGDNGYISTSTNLHDWTERINPASIGNKKLMYIIYDGNPKRFIAVGEHMTILTSNDGITWTKRIKYDISNNRTAISIIFDNSKSRFILYWKDRTSPYSRGCMYSDNNGDNWSNIIDFGYYGAIGEDCIKFKNLFITVGYGQDDSGNIPIRTSNTGIDNFAGRYGNTPFYGICKKEDNSIAIAVGSNCNIVKSTDGVNWIQKHYESNYYLYSVIYYKNTFYAVGSSGAILQSSDDGETWEKINKIEINSNLNRIRNVNTNLCLVCNDGNIIIQDLNKYLIKQKSNYYTIKSEFYKNGNYEPITELEGKEIFTETDFQVYGIDDLNLLTKTIDIQVINGIDKGSIGGGKYFEISLNNEIGKIKLQPISKEVNVTDEVIKDKSFLKWYSFHNSATINLPEDYYSKISCVFHGDGTSGNQTDYNATFYYSDGTTEKVLNKYKKCYKIVFDLTYTSFISFDIYKIFQLRYLIQYNNIIYTFDEESIKLSPSKTLDEGNFINNGFVDSTAITEEQWNTTFTDKSNVKLLMWTDDMNKTDVNIEVEIIPFRPMDKFKENGHICNILFKEVREV
ncbi:MAG: hypothetical protein E7215_11395 [Clostridium sulfidigenes]|uniref:Photosynthesis system II assembly factor Ycf48/Hcf136-like domain-containing protein n=1 Tax=Clostridium sulfidigenes TaxID=318464 RepID=A0A927WCN3_9CLOT|nr:hypothetical protein [Clostridium sulfidigenes]